MVVVAEEEVEEVVVRGDNRVSQSWSGSGRHHGCLIIFVRLVGFEAGFV